MLARDYCDAVGIKLKPIILSHHMLYGLKKGQEKMSKSDPDSAIFMEDTEEVHGFFFYLISNLSRTSPEKSGKHTALLNQIWMRSVQMKECTLFKTP